jgi:hypothetical protein
MPIISMYPMGKPVVVGTQCNSCAWVGQRSGGRGAECCSGGEVGECC